jgi:ATP-binding cassette subfamily F protein uup
MIADYPGTVILVSHDRDFLDCTVTSVLMAEGGGRWTEYAGGYSDMLTQRGEGVRAASQPAPARPAPAAKAGAAPAAAKRRLSFKEKHALETLPARIETLQRDADAAAASLADPALFGRDPAAFATLATALEATEAALAAAEAEWLRLELLREEVEG